MAYGFDDPGSYAFFVASPDGAYEEWEAALEAILADPRYRPGTGFLADHRAQRSILRDGIVRRILFLERHREVLKGGRCAVVTSPGFNYGMARMAEALMRDGPVAFRAFTDVDEGRAWLTAPR